MELLLLLIVLNLYHYWYDYCYHCSWRNSGGHFTCTAQETGTELLWQRADLREGEEGICG